MPITIKLNQLDNIVSSLNNVVSKDIPIKISYQLSKLLKQIMEEYKNFSEQRNKLIDKYGEKDEKGKLVSNENSVKIKVGCTEQCAKELGELNNIEYIIDSYSPLSIESLGEINIKPQDLYILNQFFVD